MTFARLYCSLMACPWRLYRSSFNYITVSSYSRWKQNPGLGRRLRAIEMDDEDVDENGRKRHNRGLKKLNSFENDKQLIQDLEDDEEGDLDVYESDFSNVSNSYDDYKQDSKWREKVISRKMTIQRYFKPPKQPTMLTWNEIHQIKYLHEIDPEQWDVKALAESFPATRDIIKKVLKSKYTPQNAKDIERRHKLVLHNWQLLKENKLKGDEKYLHHLQKFSERKPEMLTFSPDEMLKYLEEKKETPQWNNGQMKGIIERYEQLINKFEKSQPNLIESPKHLIKSQVDSDLNHGTDTLRLEYISSLSKESCNIETLEEKIIQNIEKGKNVTMLEKSVVANKIPKKIQLNRTSNDTLTRLSKLAGYNVSNKMTDTNSKLNEEEKVSLISSSHKNDNENLNSNISKEIQFESVRKVSGFKGTHSPALFPDEGLKKASYKENSSYAVERETKQKESISPEECVNLEDSKLVPNFSTEVSEYSYKNDEEKEYFAKETEDIEDTFFWNSSPNEDNKERKNEKSEECELVSGTEKFPMHIKIPNGKKNSGLTFKVNNCYYDDDGAFLYRVPGVTK